MKQGKGVRGSMTISARHGSFVLDGVRLIKAALEDLMVAHRVDLALWGHHHSYQRTCQVGLVGRCQGRERR